MTVRKIAIDPGFHAIKVAEVRDPGAARPDVCTVDSVVGVGSTDLGMLDTGLTRAKTAKPYRVQFGDVWSTWSGRRWPATPGPSSAWTSTGWGTRPASAPACTPRCTPSSTAAIRTWPSSPACRWSCSRESRPKKRWTPCAAGWKGNTASAWTATQAHLNVLEVKVRAQPQGALFEWALNMHGQWAHPTATIKDRIAVLDLGFNTLDLFTIQDGQISKRFTGGNTSGVRRAATALADMLAARGLTVSLHEADAWVQACVQSPRKKLETHVGGDTVNLRPLVQRALQSTTEEVLTFVERAWGNARQFQYVILTGGGALAIGDALLRQIPHATLLPDPVTANARGLARFAQRPKTFSVE